MLRTLQSKAKQEQNKQNKKQRISKGEESKNISWLIAKSKRNKPTATSKGAKLDKNKICFIIYHHPQGFAPEKNTGNYKTVTEIAFINEL